MKKISPEIEIQELELDIPELDIPELDIPEFDLPDMGVEVEAPFSIGDLPEPILPEEML